MTKEKKKRFLFKLKEKNPITTVEQLEKFSFRSTKQQKFNSGIIKFTKFYFLNKIWVKYLICVLIGLILSFSVVIFVQSTGLYTGGFGALFQGIARLTFLLLSLHNSSHAEMNAIIYNILFYGLYLALNVPLAIFAYKKIGKQFAKLSITFVITTQVMGFVWAAIPSQIPGTGFFEQIRIFGDTTTVNSYMNDYNVQVILFYPNWFPIPGATSGSFDWNIETLLNRDATPDTIVSSITSTNLTRALLLGVYALTYSLISSVCYAIIFIVGGSTAGSDFVVIYLSQKKNKDVGSLFIILNLMNMSIGILLGSYTTSVLYGAYYGHVGMFSGWQYFFSANYFTSIVWVIAHGVLMNKWFPWHKLIRVEIFSNRTDDIRKRFRQIEYTHPSTIINSVGGYSGNPTQTMITICMCIELPKIVSEIRKVDDKCLISSNFIADLDGYITTQQQTG